MYFCICKPSSIKVGKIKRLYLIMSAFLGAVFVVSGVSKLFYLDGFTTEVIQYTELYLSAGLVGYSGVAALSLCILETVSGFMAFFSVTRCLSSWVILALSSFFVYLTARNCFFPTFLGSVESCGCFGELLHFSPEASFVKSFVVWIVALYVNMVALNRVKPVFLKYLLIKNLLIKKTSN